jgi:16S rRNA (cytosine1402-N4)-methyltransferase
MTFHKPVLLQESIVFLNLKKGGIFVDATLGGGGHTEAMLKSSDVKQVFAFDQDDEAFTYAGERLQAYADRLTVIKSNFEEIRTQLALCKIKGIDGALFDLGVSSHQIDTVERGFSFEQDANLDMRMNRQADKTAKDILNQASVEELTRIFRDYGEEQAAYKIAQWLITARSHKTIESTLELSNIIEKNMRSNPAMVTKTKARIFQALRIYLNRELEVLDSALEDVINLLKPKGRLVVISYHSLEDRIVKIKMNQAAQGCTCPKTILKCVCNQKPKVKILTSKTVRPSEQEQQDNHRSRSAKLRAVEKI